MLRFQKPVKESEFKELSELTKGGLVFEVDTNHVNEQQLSDSDDDTEVADNNLDHTNKECIGIFDEDTYEEGDPFEIIAQKMFSLIPNGKIKKRVIREGEGEKPEEFAVVKIHYNAYLEFHDEPFDSTYKLNRLRKFTVGNGQVIAGLDFAVQSMKPDEKSQFLIHPDYAFGKSCLIGRVPPNSHVLFEVELIDVVNSGAAVTYSKLPLEEQKRFPEVYKYCTALCETGKRFVKEHDHKNAIKNYNEAVSKLDKVFLNGKDELEKQRELSMRLYTNLLICYSHMGEPRKGIYNAKEIYRITENGELQKIPAKVYFNHAKCLRFLSEYEEAKAVLEKAYKLEPKNPEIINEMINLERDKEDHKQKQMIFAKALINN